MKVLVDTSVWSLAIRRSASTAGPETRELAELIREGRVVMMGPIRQELLSGVRSARQFDELREHLAPFPDLVLDSEDYEEAARCFNRCRAKGVQGSNTDFLLCATTLRHDLAVFTTDKDFGLYAKHLRIRLHCPRGTG